MSICANLWSEKTICGLTFLSTDYHRLTQIFLISKDIVIITDFYFGTDEHGFFKDTAWLRIVFIHNQSSAGAPKAHKQSQLCCVDNHEQPRRGESLFARTGPAGQALSPLYPEGKGDLGESGGAPLQVKRGRGSFRKRRNLS